MTPTSAKTAIHIVAIPNEARKSTSSFTAMANTTFCMAMPMVRRAMAMAVAILDGLSSMSTTSAASIAASEPSAPMAIPTSARASTGASLMPSPTKTVFSLSVSVFKMFSIMLTLSAGRSSEWHSSMHSFCATSSPTSRRSPVSMTVFFTPSSFREPMASCESSLMMSATTIWPTYTPSTATCTIVPAL